MADGHRSHLPSEFKLERYFAEYEFNPDVKHLMCCSDVEAISLKELVDMADPETRKLWEGLSLGYTESSGHPLLMEEVAKIHEVDKDDVLVVCPQEGIYLAMHCMVDMVKRKNPGRIHAVATFPSYQSLFENLKTLGVEVDYWNTEFEEGKGWRFTIDGLKARLTDDTRILVVNFPHNPTGFFPSEEMWKEILQIARERNLLLFSDEMYRFAINDAGVKQHRSACADNENAVTLFGMSKTYALPGLRIGWVCTRNRELMTSMRSFHDYTTICSSAPSEILALIGLKNRDAIVARTLEINRKNLKVLEDFAAEFPALFEWYSPVAGTTGLLKIKGRLLEFGGAKGFCQKLVEEAGILMVPGAIFDFSDDCARIGFGRKNIPQAVDALRDYINTII